MNRPWHVSGIRMLTQSTTDPATPVASVRADPLPYESPYAVCRYSRVAMLSLAAGICAGPLIVSPIVGAAIASHYLREAVEFVIFIPAILVAIAVAVFIPWLAVSEGRRLRNSSYLRGKKLIQNGMMMYLLWVTIPLFFVSLPLLPLLVIRPMLLARLISVYNAFTRRRN
jgi:hypothetical protein